jgi:guanine nucleotide-binding protein G(i) subunit alpha
MHESLTLFDSVCNSKWFRSSSMILFLNKTDIFADKIQRIPMTDCFPSYTGACARHVCRDWRSPGRCAGPREFDPAKDFIAAQFDALNKTPTKKIYTFFTCATDTKNIENIFTAVTDSIITLHLREAGILQ